MAENQTSGTDVVLMVCIECGTEYEFDDDEAVPGGLTCEKCGNQVFRRFDASARPGEAEAEFQDATERDLDTDDAEGDAVPGDLRDLNNP